MIQEENPGFDAGRGGALVEEAKKLMAQDEEEGDKAVENAGPKIKMNKIGRKGRKGEPAAKAAAAGASDAHQHPTEKTWKSVEKTENQGFSE